jgi:hypothetical protein
VTPKKEEKKRGGSLEERAMMGAIWKELLHMAYGMGQTSTPPLFFFFGMPIISLLNPATIPSILPSTPPPNFLKDNTHMMHMPL